MRWKESLSKVVENGTTSWMSQTRNVLFEGSGRGGTDRSVEKGRGRVGRFDGVLESV